jgi:CheY-like chemotaxis protein
LPWTKIDLSCQVIPRHHLRVLCVDDNDSVLDMLKIALAGSGYDIETARNGYLALQKINKNPQRFEVIITDIRMPGMDGYGLIEASRTAGYSGPFVVCAGMISPDDRQRLQELHVSRVILKPARAAELIAALREAQTSF